MGGPDPHPMSAHLACAAASGAQHLDSLAGSVASGAVQLQCSAVHYRAV